jgi:hypothetical protein
MLQGHALLRRSRFLCNLRAFKDQGWYRGQGGSFCTCRNAHPAAVIKISHGLVGSPKLILDAQRRAVCQPRTWAPSLQECSRPQTITRLAWNCKIMKRHFYTERVGCWFHRNSGTELPDKTMSLSDCSLPCYGTMCSYRRMLGFRRNILPPYAVSKCKHFSRNVDFIWFALSI